MAKVTIKVNGKNQTRTVEDRMLLVDFLRDELKLTGTHVGCDTSQCGCCTVHVDGRAVKSCSMLAAQAHGANIVTIEGMAKKGKLHPIQRAFSECHGLQCGFCTPGILMSALAFLNETPDPTDEQIREVLSGNLCRCTGYQGIVDAIRDAARRLRERA